MYWESQREMGVLKSLTEEYCGVSKREEDRLVLMPRKREDIDIIDEYSRLTEEQKELLQNGASLDFCLDDYTSLANVLNKMGVKVRICKGIKWFYDSHSRDYIDEFELYWRRKLGQRLDLLEPILERLKEERDWLEAYTIRGRYLRKEKIIELYPDEMKAEPNGIKFFEYLLLTTFVHEAMHAYFDRTDSSEKHSDYTYARFVEEPMAEFGMLLWLKETMMPDALQKWAYNDVAVRRSCYRYGATLFDQYCDWNTALRNYLEKYKYRISKYAMLDLDKSGKHVALPCPDIKIGKMAKREFTARIPYFSRDILYKLQDKDYCKKEFDLNYPVLSNKLTKTSRKNRYYADPVDGYYICSEWYERYREQLEVWLLRH